METYHIYYSSEDLPSTWNDLVGHDIFLQASYLQALEEASPNNIQLFYIGVFKDDNLVGGAIVQRVQLYLKDMFRKTKVSCVKEFVQDLVSKVLKGNILVVGNLTHTGQHGVFYLKDKIDTARYLNTVSDALEELREEIKATQNKKIRAILWKDYFLDDPIHIEEGFFKKQMLYKIVVQPNMIMPVRQQWQNFGDYVGSLTKKYRDRYKRARKKFNTIHITELDLEAVYKEAPRLHKLYLNVSNNAKFNTFLLPDNHFYSLKLRLGNHFKIFGYYIDNELVGFYTLLLNKGDLETYFLGYDKEHQYPNQLYLNMLYDMAQYAIENKFSTIVYARTAMEIKSSVGAEPKAMVVYLKHTNGVMNTVLKIIFWLMNPKQKWNERHPFK
ncbi:GNAT family N-acetyltransferase [Snuella sedimenti]|uniref:GNAT family N-acetyltransferase n=1 Tax=Snuella sedimenti TaxID=2798802 RepID=A0A8J7LN77_9FLAO|nr:GNAT family N-acetyltransferase [Snuella sedimenti]MBJ6368454.1 GNAT family N-acetyltransferase [Snuella sedimenti]